MSFPLVLLPMAAAFLSLAIGTVFLGMTLDAVNNDRLPAFLAEIFGTIGLFIFSCFCFAAAVMG